MYSTVLFDLDGTLTDPYIGITNGIMHALRKMGRDVPSRESLRHFIGPPLIEEFQHSFGMDSATAEQAAAYYREYYFEKGVYENKLISGAKELLEDARASGRKVCLATCKPESAALIILDYFGIREHFDLIGAARLDGSIRTKSEVLRYVLENTGALPEDCVLVGDRLHDIVGAHDVGMKCIGVLVGFGSREEFDKYGADYVAETLSDVLKFLKK